MKSASTFFDIQQACDLLVEFTHRKSLADYNADPLLRSGVERQFEIVGEAPSQLLRLEPTFASSISDTRRIVTFRNRPIHGYDSLADEVVWSILETNLPVLRREVAALLHE